MEALKPRKRARRYCRSSVRAVVNEAVSGTQQIARAKPGLPAMPRMWPSSWSIPGQRRCRWHAGLQPQGMASTRPAPVSKPRRRRSRRLSSTSPKMRNPSRRSCTTSGRVVRDHARDWDASAESSAEPEHLLLMQLWVSSLDLPWRLPPSATAQAMAATPARPKAATRLPQVGHTAKVTSSHISLQVYNCFFTQLTLPCVTSGGTIGK